MNDVNGFEYVVQKITIVVPEERLTPVGSFDRFFFSLLILIDAIILYRYVN